MQTVEEQIISTAKSMLTNDMHLVEGCRILCRLQHEVDESHERLFLVIIGIESQTDHLVLGEARRNCEQTYLKKVDEEIDTFLEELKPGLMEACTKLVEVFQSCKRGTDNSFPKK